MTDHPGADRPGAERPWEDPILAEIHAVRERLFEEAGGDIDRLYDMLKASEAARGITPVSRPPRRPETGSHRVEGRSGEAA